MEDASELRIQARRAESRGDHERARELYLRALALGEDESDVSDPGLLVRVGDLEERRGESDSAQSYYGRAVEAYADQGLLTNAVAVCNKILRVFPEAFGARARLAGLHLDLGLTADARQHIRAYVDGACEEHGASADLTPLRRFLEREPDQEVALRLADELVERGHEDDALSVLREVWRSRARQDLQREALEQRARELDEDVEIERWSPSAGESPERGGSGDRRDAGAALARDPFEQRPGNLGVLGELEEDDAERDRSELAVLTTLARTLEHRHLETERHAEPVGELAARLAEALGLARWQVQLIRDAAPLHDVGMVVVPDRVLLKEGRLTEEEREIMKSHAANGARMLADGDLPVLQLGSEIAHTHHERWDGTGYPQGLKGDRIPVAGRIVAVAEAFEAITHERPFREAEPVDRARAELRRAAGEQFDPRIVEALCDVQASTSPTDPGGGEDGGASRMSG